MGKGKVGEKKSVHFSVWKVCKGVRRESEEELGNIEL